MHNKSEIKCKGVALFYLFTFKCFFPKNLVSVNLKCC